MTDRYQCPERGCMLTLNESELVSHLEWDHEHDRHRAERLLTEAMEDL